MGAGDVKFVAATGSLARPALDFLCPDRPVASPPGSTPLSCWWPPPRWRETLLNIQILWLRLACLGRHLGPRGPGRGRGEAPDRRRRLIPFSAMIAMGLVVTLLLAAEPVLRAARDFPTTPITSRARWRGGQSRPDIDPLPILVTEVNHETPIDHGHGVSGLGLGRLGRLGVRQYVGRGEAPPVETVSVVVAATTIPRGMLVSADLIKTRDYPKDLVPTGAILKVEDALDRSAFTSAGQGRAAAR